MARGPLDSSRRASSRRAGSAGRSSGRVPGVVIGTMVGARRYRIGVLTQACGHVANPSPVRVCPHLVAVAEDAGAPDLVALLTGEALAYDLACTACDRGDGPAALTGICEGCAGTLLEENDITAWRGRPGILERPDPVKDGDLEVPVPEVWRPTLRAIVASLVRRDARLGAPWPRPPWRGHRAEGRAPNLVHAAPWPPPAVAGR